jgi:DNA invertase Pin-like site-specific DNA recombinase
MNSSKVSTAHLQRLAYIYIRQSTAAQVEHNRESTDRQYKLIERAHGLGWPNDRVTVVDTDLAKSADGTAQRNGFETMFTDVALHNVGLILSIEVSRLARNNSDWYRLLDLCGVTDTLIGDEDGLYHPGLFNDRLLLGLKGTMAEAELHVIRARLNGGIRNKAARGELRRGLPVGLEWGESDGEIRLVPNEAVVGAIRIVFEKFTEFGSVRRVWLYFHSQQLQLPSRRTSRSEIRWTIPTYHAIHTVLTNPVYGGAYVYGRSQQETYVDEQGQLKKRTRRRPQSEWGVLIPEHHEGYIDWKTYQMNRERIERNIRPGPHNPGAIREGMALLQGLATCGRCGRRLHVYYQGKNGTPGYYCGNNNIVNGRGERCLQVGGLRIDRAVAHAFLDAVTPAGMEAALRAEQQCEIEYQATIQQWQRQVERAEYEAQRAERRYRSVEPENRLVARTLEVQWEQRLSELDCAQAELARQEQQRPESVTDEQREHLRTLGQDLQRVWDALTTTDRDRKELLNLLLEEVNIRLEKSDTQSTAYLVLRWRGGAICELNVDLRVCRQPAIRTDEQTIDLLRRLASHYDDAIIAGILNRQGRRTATGQRFTANHVGSLRRYRKIARYDPSTANEEGDLVTIQKAAEILGLAPSTIHRWLADGFIAGEQLTPGAPWRIRVNDELQSRFVETAPAGFVPMIEATRILGVSRQTVLQRVKLGQLEAVHIRCGRRKGLRIKVIDAQPSLFTQSSLTEV